MFFLLAQQAFIRHPIRHEIKNVHFRCPIDARLLPRSNNKQDQKEVQIKKYHYTINKVKQKKRKKKEQKDINMAATPIDQTTNNPTSQTNKGNESIFQSVLSDVNSLSKDYLGEDYPYYKMIKTPDQLGMSSKGTLKQMGKNMDGLISYVSLLVSGKSDASKTGQPLGNKYFLKTGAKCTDAAGQTQDRDIYINNIPGGNIPFVSSGLGVNFSEFRGLIPGTISNLNAMNPMQLFQSFLSDSSCQEVTLEVVDIHNNKHDETHFLTLVDIQNMDACSFKNKRNPISGAKCKETFQIRNAQEQERQKRTRQQQQKQKKKGIRQQLMNHNIDIPLVLYLASLSSLSLYIVYKLLVKCRLMPKL